MEKTKRKSLIFTGLLVLVLMFTAMFGLAGCGNDNNNAEVNMTQSYRTARVQFNSVTGIQVPELENLEVNAYPYTAGDREYCIDITSGSALNYQTYLVFENFFKTTLGNCDVGYPDGNETNGRNAQWSVNDRRYQTTWDAVSRAIHINTTIIEEDGNHMTERYASGRQTIYQITGYYIPEVPNVEILDTSTELDIDSKTGRFDFWADSTIYGTFTDYLKELFPAEPIMEEENNIAWEFDAVVNENDARYNIEVNFVQITGSSYISMILQVRDFYNFALDTTVGGYVTLQMGGQIIVSNTASALAGDNLTITATADENYQFDGWYIEDNLVSYFSPYTYEMPAQDVTIVGKFSVKPVQMTESYSAGRTVFEAATGIELPAISKIEADIAFGNNYVMLDIVTGENLTQTTYDNILEFLDGLDGWTGSDATQEEMYPTKQYTNSSTGVVFQVVWNNESAEGGIYLNTMSGITAFDAYASAISYVETRLGMYLPEMSTFEMGLTVDFSCGNDLSYMTFDITKATNFTESDYDIFVYSIIEFIGDDGTDQSEEGVNKKTGWVWIVDSDKYFTVEWDLTIGIAINMSTVQS